MPDGAGCIVDDAWIDPAIRAGRHYLAMLDPHLNERGRQRTGDVREKDQDHEQDRALRPG
jgi:hypothetical protein